MVPPSGSQNVDAEVDDATAAVEVDATATFPDGDAQFQDGDFDPRDGNDVAATFPDQAHNQLRGGDMTSAARSPPLQDGKGYAAVKVRVAADMKVGVAFDLMRVKVGEAGQLAKFTPALLAFFADEERRKEEARNKDRQKVTKTPPANGR